ncbi:MAG: choice-of-anchor D domain-containing protein [Candidatus Kapaibacterium sp.]
MRNKFTLVLMALTIALTGMFAANTAEAAKRKIVIEDHTGAWCGWCPRGMESLEKLEDEFGDEVIGVAVHNGDQMAISTYQTPLATMIGLTGYPSGSVSRIINGGKIAQSDGVWTPMTKQYIGNDVPVGVKLDLDYNKSTGAYTATITATVESPVNANLTFNLWAVQDSMMGSGTGWDQSNYLSGRAGYESSKFFTEAASIKNFVHMNVFRGATAGLEGEQGTFPAGTVPAGTYKQVYTGNVSALNVTDKNRAYFVAVVHNKDNKEIINADRVGKPEVPRDKLAATVTDAYISVVDDTKHIAEITLTNEQEWGITADIAINANNSVLPAGWGISVSNTSVTLAPNATRKIQVEVLKNKIEGFGQVNLTITPRDNGKKVVKTDATAYFMSENIDNAIIYGFEDALAPVVTGVVNSGVMPNAVMVSGASDVIANFPQMANFKTAVLTTSDRSLAFSTEETAKTLELINSWMNSGTDFMITGVLDMVNYGGVVTDASPSAAATDFFRNKLGVEYTRFFGLVANNQLSSLPITGISGDEISNGMVFSLNEAYSQAYPNYATYATCFSFNGKTSAEAFLITPVNASLGVTADNNKIGLKLDNNGQRTVFVSIPLDPINNPNRDLLFKNILTWLKGTGATAKGPSISLNTTQVVFGEIKQDQTGSETLKISNTGDEALVISAINFKTGSNFKVKGSTPLTVDAGQTVNVNIEFTPTEIKNYSDEITIVSNDKANPNSVLTVMGIGISSGTASVTGIIPNVFTMTVGPNPVVNSSEINLDINGSVNLDLELIDATGKVVRNIFSGVSTSNTLELNAAQLSSGTYYLNANVNGKTTQLPVVITK